MGRHSPRRTNEHRGGLEDYYGGIFEILFLENGEIKPVLAITFLFLDVSIKGNDEINITFEPILKIGYHNDVLIVRKVSLINFTTEVHGQK